MLWTDGEGPSALTLPLADRGRIQPGDALADALTDPWHRVDLRTAPVGTYGLPGRLWSDGYAEVVLALRADVDAQPGTSIGGFFLTMATRTPGGFAGASERLARVDAALVGSLRIRAWSGFATTIARTYLGRDPGDQVLAGRVHRGDAITVRAALAFVDLRGFTTLSEREPSEVVFDLLDDYYDAVVGAIEASGGDVLQYMGDGVLAIWPDGRGDGRAACDAALAGANDADQRVAAANGRRLAAGKPPIEYGMSLHLGDMSYGNMGAAHRLAFTALGPAVNQAARLEAIGARLGLRPVLSRAFADAVSVPCVAHGAHEARGIGTIEAWGLAEVGS
jgi:adenylate cyclase